MKTILIKKPGKMAYVAQSRCDLDDLYSIVDGFIEFVNPRRYTTQYGLDIAIIVNDEGRIRQLEPNIYFEDSKVTLYGNVIFCRMRNGVIVSLTKTDIKKLEEKINKGSKVTLL